ASACGVNSSCVGGAAARPGTGLLSRPGTGGSGSDACRARAPPPPRRSPVSRAAAGPALGLPSRSISPGSMSGEPPPRPLRPGKFHRLEESNQALVVGLVHRELRERHLERHVGVERDELLRQPRALGILDQRLATLLLFDLAGPRQQRFEVAVFADELRRSLH